MERRLDCKRGHGRHRNVPDRKSAMLREIAIKKMRREMKMKLAGKSLQVDTKMKDPEET